MSSKANMYWGSLAIYKYFSLTNTITNIKIMKRKVDYYEKIYYSTYKKTCNLLQKNVTMYMKAN